MNNETRFTSRPRPFIKWAGSKTKVLSKLYSYVPEKFEDYYEPFLGGGAMFFHLIYKRAPFRAYLSDLNEELINTFIVVVFFAGIPFLTASSYVLLAGEIMEFSMDFNTHKLYSLMEKKGYNTTPREITKIYPEGFIKEREPINNDLET